MSEAVFSTRLLNETGDVVITWTENEDEEILRVIQKKMDEGTVFFMIEKRGAGLLPPRETRLKSAEDALRTRTVMAKDADFVALIDSGKAKGQHAAPPPDVETTKRATSAEEVASGHSVAVQPVRGG